MAEKHKSEITMHDVDASALQKLIEFAYTGEIIITEENVQVGLHMLLPFFTNISLINSILIFSGTSSCS